MSSRPNEAPHGVLLRVPGPLVGAVSEALAAPRAALALPLHQRPQLDAGARLAVMVGRAVWALVRVSEVIEGELSPEVFGVDLSEGGRRAARWIVWSAPDVWRCDVPQLDAGVWSWWHDTG